MQDLLTIVNLKSNQMLHEPNFIEKYLTRYSL